MVTKTNPDYSESAFNLTNKAELAEMLNQRRYMEARILGAKTAAGLPVMEQELADLDIKVRQAIDTLGSYQDVENGKYAVKQRRQSIIYSPDKVREYLGKYAPAIIDEHVNEKVLTSLIKGGQVSDEIVPQLVEDTRETFAYIIRTGVN
ncbi:MAG: hypothetical protein A9183_06900 [Dehalococcoides mccartyi]|uniref:hypothetical protein n=1 Tax=Dehalococcoides mccartyi TaxID=61435 RepID=UPI0008049413|nr:hypothetical protein [Dehalococcoides mccartyi]OBW62614.1 MAG: hypothetical protein A9183_06900 [Dehalococcoides mccartyi]